MQVVAAGANPIQITRGIEKTTKALVADLKLVSKEVNFRTCFNLVMTAWVWMLLFYFYPNLIERLR